MQHFRLRYLTNDVELFPGEFVVGRSEECQLSIDDGMVSRRHALLRVTPQAVTLVDLGSRNGVSLNGVRIQKDTPLQDGDRILIGRHELVLRVQDSESKRNTTNVARTLGAIDISQLELESIRPVEGSAKEVARILGSFATLATLAEKALVMGRAEEAERLVSACFSDLMAEVRKGSAMTAEQLESFDALALKLSAELVKASWVEWMLEVHRVSGVVLSGPTVEALLALGPRLKHLSRDVILDYVQAANERPLNANERFRLHRLDGLARRLSTAR
jgi:pSer/pThr/pTyr-binding forkhead associated (FHA) protein